jgi:hypothetical protein
VPVFPLSAAVEAALRSAAQGGQITRGLEGAERLLTSEDKGLGMADEKSGTARGVRISRLLVLADDGAQRFYRNVEALLVRHGPRVLALRFEVDANHLGETLFGEGEIARLALLTRKEAVVAALLALLETPAPSA